MLLFVTDVDSYQNIAKIADIEVSFCNIMLKYNAIFKKNTHLGKIIIYEETKDYKYSKNIIGNSRWCLLHYSIDKIPSKSFYSRLECLAIILLSKQYVLLRKHYADNHLLICYTTLDIFIGGVCYDDKL